MTLDKGTSLKQFEASFASFFISQAFNQTGRRQCQGCGETMIDYEQFRAVVARNILHRILYYLPFYYMYCLLTH